MLLSDTARERPVRPSLVDDDGPPPSRLTQRLRAIAESHRFQLLSIAVIVANAVLIGAETYPAMRAHHHGLLLFLDEVCLAFFTVEIAIRVGAFGSRPWRYFGNGWNVFDLVVVVAALLPGLRENITLLRLFRLARVVRIVRSFPHLRVLLTAVWRSLPGAAGLFGVAGVMLFLYGMVGWMLFGTAMPETFGTIGDAALSLFTLMTMDNVGATIRDGMAVTPWAVPYFLSFVVVVGLVLINLLIGVVITSMEEARHIEDSAANGASAPRTPVPVTAPETGAAVDAVTTELAGIMTRLDRLQTTLDGLTVRATASERPRSRKSKRRGTKRR